MSPRDGDAIWLSAEELELLAWLVAGSPMARYRTPGLVAKLKAALAEAGKIG